ncbi:MAG: hypothetical protein ACRCU5_10015 [Rhizobiaceae bacterium]
MFLMAPLWIGAVTHLAMLHFAFYALCGVISRAWLLLPLCFYGAGYAMHVKSVSDIKAEVAAIERQNAAVRLSVDKPFQYLREGNSDTFSLIEHYRVDRSFLRQQDGSITTTFFAKGTDCVNAGNYNRRDEPWAIRADVFSYYPGKKTLQCILSQDSLPANWRYRIKGSYTYEKDRASWLFKRYGSMHEIFDDKQDTKLGTIETATFYPMPTVPKIFAGCGLNSGAAKWQCSWGFVHGSTPYAAGYKQRSKTDPQRNPFTPSQDPETWGSYQLAKALGLEMRQPMD